VQVLTDHRQFYDGIFDDRPPVFHRMAFTRGGLPKREQFALFARMGLTPPPHGLARELLERVQASAGSLGPLPAAAETLECVVYTDEYGHRGAGKARLPLSQAAAEHPGCLASLYFPHAGAPTAYRYVRFGGLFFWLRQSGDRTGWRSNSDDQESVLEKGAVASTNPVPRVLWAIDFIPSPLGLLALDFNTAPDLATLGESGALTAAEARAELAACASACPEQLLQF
jgi:hypothetical protein